MKKVSLLSVAVFAALTSFAQSPAASDTPASSKKSSDKTIMAAPLTVTAESSTDIQMVPAAAMEEASLVSEAALNGLAFADASAHRQGKPKGKKEKSAGSEQEQEKEKQKVKEVAPSKRQEKPEKVGASAAKSAARPGRGAARAVKSTTSSATKSVGNAAKAVKPVKVGGKVGVGSIIKVGKN